MTDRFDEGYLRCREDAAKECEDLPDEYAYVGAHCAAIIRALSPPEPVSGWIPVSERLPETDSENCSVDCLLFADGDVHFGYIYLRDLQSERGEGFSYRHRKHVIASHWMPLPEPPLAASEKGGS